MNNCYEEKWLALKEEIDRRGADGEAVTAALRDYYSIFEDRALVWLGNLYNTEIGGFHYSNSSKNNPTVTTDAGTFDLLPDIESSFQAMSMLIDSGAISSFDELPGKMREGLIKFISSLQDKESGFIIHPQWKHIMRDGFGKNPNADRIWRSRRGRDMMWAIGMTERLGFTLPYPTAYERLDMQKDKEEKNDILPDYLTDKDKFIAFLDTLDFENDAYYAGNMVAAQDKLIVAAGLGDVAVDYITEKQHKDTGLWGNKGGYAAINAYLKTTSIYAATKKLIPNTDKAAMTIINCATTEEKPATVCFQYNVWYSILNILDSLRNYGGEEGNKKADELSSSLLKNCTEAIKATKEKALSFKKADGSFSYSTYATADHSMGMPVAFKGENEGDVNATNICSNGTARRMFKALGLLDFFIPLYSENAFEEFVKAAKCK